MVGELLFECVEGVASDVVVCLFACGFGVSASENGFDAEGEFFHGEGFCDVVVGTDFESFEYVVLECFGSEEDDGYLLVDVSNFACECESVFFWHHDVEYADVVVVVEEGVESGFAVGGEFGVVAFGEEVFAEEHAEVFVVFAE